VKVSDINLEISREELGYIALTCRDKPNIPVAKQKSCCCYEL